MVYIIVLNWNNAKDTISCLKSLLALDHRVMFRIIVCDNNSSDDSYCLIRSWLYETLSKNNMSLLELDRDSSEKFHPNSSVSDVYLIQSGINLGFAGGNNVGIRFAVKQLDAKYVWLLNNDTEVDSEALHYLVKKMCNNPKIGICGSKLVYYNHRHLLQGLGGIHNRFLSTTKHYKALSPSDIYFSESEVDSNIDYIIGASMFICVDLIKNIGFLSEDYFLYYEEMDYAERSRRLGYKLGVAQNSVVYHKEGATTKAYRGDLSDYLSVVNRVVFTRKFNKRFLVFVYLSLFVSVANRLRRREFSKGLRILKFMFGVKSYIIENSTVRKL